MREIFKIVVNAVYILSFFGVILSGLLGVFYEFVGYARFQKILSKIGIYNGFEQVWFISMILLFLLIVTYLTKTKFFN